MKKSNICKSKLGVKKANHILHIDQYRRDRFAWEYQCRKMPIVSMIDDQKSKNASFAFLI
jgi:hypothetical protein